MTNTITINNQNLALRQYKGQMVVTFKDIDLVHNRPQGTASRNFRSNRQHFIEGEDYFKITPDEFRRTIGTMDKRQQNDVTLITESGYLMLVKSFTDDLSWEVQRQLVKTYFRYKEQPKLPDPNDKPYEYFDKTYNGVPVLTTADIEHLTGVNAIAVVTYIRKKTVAGKDHYRLVGDELKSFKAENPKLTKMLKCIYAITRSGFIKFCRAYGIKVEEPKCFEAKTKSQIDDFPCYSPNIEMKELMEEVRNKAMKIQALSYMLSDKTLTSMSRLYRGNLRYVIMELNGMVDKIDAVRI